MSAPTPKPHEHSTLRVNAEGLLKAGSAPATKGWPVSARTLSLLHELASAPESAGDALKLLHELQVYQVELDLQHEQMETDRREFAEGLARYKGLFESAPAAYVNVGPAGDIIEGNRASADLFGVGQDELRGRRIDSFLAPESRPLFRELLQRLREGGSRDACEVQSRGGGNVSRHWQVVASVTPGGGSFLMIFMDTTDRKREDLKA